MTVAVTKIASISAMGAAQKMPVTPKATGINRDSTISSASRKIDSGAAALALPMDCRKIAHTFWTQVNRIRAR